MYTLMQSLNVEDNTEGLRYDKVILATDADVDGMHIRNLMITYFYSFKGVGEISPKEFAQFIGKEMRLSNVEYAPRAESGPIFSFYMGKNTPERKD